MAKSKVCSYMHASFSPQAYINDRKEEEGPEESKTIPTVPISLTNLIWKTIASVRTTRRRISSQKTNGMPSWMRYDNICRPRSVWREVDSALFRTSKVFAFIFPRFANTLNATIMETHVPSLSDVTFEGQRIPPPVQIAWYIGTYEAFFRIVNLHKVSRWSGLAIQCAQEGPAQVT